MALPDDFLRTLPGRPAARHPDPRALVRELLRPEAYPEPRPSGVEVRHTHASWVFLTDDEAWKVKRPVRHDGPDYGDPDRRRRCCEDEVRLGRRLAPDVYRGVAPIEGAGSFVGGGPVVDYAVRMRRLPDEENAALMLATRRLTPLHVQRLAVRLAAFHESAPLASDAATPDMFADAICRSHEQLATFAGRFVDGTVLERLYTWQWNRAIASEAHLMDRAARGRFREGHGDLRLEHVYFPGGSPAAPLVIDPLEWDQRLRSGDTALDVALLAVDLESRHRPDLAAWFLSSYARAAEDHDLAPLADLYCSYRASERARIACLVAGDPATAPAKSSRKAAEAARMLTLAASYMSPWAPRQTMQSWAGLSPAVTAP